MQVDIKRPQTRERRDYLNVAWQVFKELEGEERLKGEDGAYLNYAKSSINDKADHLPLIHFIFEEITEGKLNPTARVYIEQGLWNADFEIKFRKHYEKEEEEQETREKERRIGKEAPGSSTDYAVPHIMMRDRERVRTWRVVFHKAEEIAQRRPKFWLDVQSVADQISRMGKGWQRDEGHKGGYNGENKGKEGYKGKDWEKGGYKGGYKGKDKCR